MPDPQNPAIEAIESLLGPLTDADKADLLARLPDAAAAVESILGKPSLTAPSRLLTLPDVEPGEPKMIDVEWDGRTWRVPADDGDWDYEALEALEHGRGISFLKAVLGRRQFAGFTTGKRRTARDANELMAAIMAQFGEAKQGE